MKNLTYGSTLVSIAMAACTSNVQTAEIAKPRNVVLIYVDDLGYGDLSSYGATAIQTPNLDRIANGGVRFTNGHSSSATSTPSRFAMITGRYPWREKNVRILPGSAPLLIDPAQMTLPRIMQNAGYKTGIVGKWHLGLGNGHVDWNQRIAPGPNELGFEHAYIMAATQDRVPTVYIENGHVVNLDPNDPIEVNYKKNYEGQATGLDNPELTTMKWHHGHNQTIINGIPRIGYMKGGKAACWNDTDMADDLLAEAQEYIIENKNEPFFLYFAMQQPHVPRTPHPRFVGKSGMGPRGDVILELDWAIGEVLKTLEDNKLMEETMIIFSSDNGPVLNDGYNDDAVELLGDHLPAGPLRGGKYSLYEAGTRVPFMVYWKGQIEPKVSDALVCQMDLFASFAHLFGQELADDIDSQNMLDVFMGLSDKGRESLIVEATSRTALKKGDYILIPPYKGAAVKEEVNIEVGNSKKYQLYNLKEDIGQRNNLAESQPKLLKEMMKEYATLRGSENLETQDFVLE